MAIDISEDSDARSEMNDALSKMKDAGLERKDARFEVNDGSMSKLVKHYRRIFKIDEIVDDVVLHWYSGALLLGFFITFNAWIAKKSTTLAGAEAGNNVCWPIFQNCRDYIWLSGLPEGYSQTSVFMAMFGVMLGCVYGMYRKKWDLVHFGILLLFIVKFYFSALTNESGNYDYYHNAFCIIYLFFGHKKFFAQLTLVFFYFLSVATKIHPSWVLGQYFTALKTGLPFVPYGAEIVATNFLMVMEMVGAWFLLSKNKILQRSAFTFFVIFHLYSGILVEYRYPATVLPPLLILFGPFFKKPEIPPIDFRSIPGWSFMAGFLVLQMIPHMIPGDEKLTLEGNFYGLFMFEANHQCYGKFTDGDGKKVSDFLSTAANERCDPYRHWFRAKHRFCKNPNSVYGFVMNHSINGDPFREIVNVPNICTLTYRPFTHNEWIKDETEAPMVGRPRQNGYGFYSVVRR